MTRHPAVNSAAILINHRDFIPHWYFLSGNPVALQLIDIRPSKSYVVHIMAT